MPSKPQSNCAPDPLDQQGTPQPEARVGCLLAIDDNGQAWVTVDDSGRAIAAKLDLALTRTELEALIASRASIVVCFDAGVATVVAVVGRAAGGGALQADLDGQRVNLSAQSEVVIACGKASITLRANGRVIIRGTHIESYSEGTNRIRGGQVRIN